VPISSSHYLQGKRHIKNPHYLIIHTVMTSCINSNLGTSLWYWWPPSYLSFS